MTAARVALAACALLVQGCAAIPVAVAVGAMGAFPGGASSERATAALAAAPPVAASPAAAAPAAPAAAAGLAPARLGVLPAQNLPPGACALFLFSRGVESAFVAFAPADGATLTLALDGKTQILAAAAPFAPSDAAFAQTYRGADGLEARLTATLGEALPQGRRAPEASLRLAAPGGAAQVTPLTGLAACEPEA